MGNVEASAVMELARLEGWLRGVAALNERGCVARTYRAWLIEGGGSETSRLDAVRAIYGTDEALRTARVEDWSAQVEAPLTRWFFAETAPARDGERLARNLVEEFVALVRACAGGEVREAFEVEGPGLVRGEIFQDVVDAWLFCAASRAVLVSCGEND